MVGVTSGPSADSGDIKVERQGGVDTRIGRRRQPSAEATTTQLRSVDAESEFDEICATITQHFARKQAVEPQLCHFIGLLPELRRADNPWLLREASIAAHYLIREDADVTTARRLVNELALRLGVPKDAPGIHVIAGVFGFLTLLTFAAFVLGLWWQNSNWSPATVGQYPGFWIFNVSPWLLIAVGAAGGLGSVISMFVRLQSFNELAGTDVRLLWMLGALKPFIGIAFALFIFATVQSNLLPFQFDENPQAHFTFVALGFVAGFSERFSRVAVTMVERRLVGSEQERPKRSDAARGV